MPNVFLARLERAIQSIDQQAKRREGFGARVRLSLASTAILPTNESQ
ncbi:hypothetical protein PLANPX_3337 [Lacipirellula parvula]|uniref:Uncharacterized protein n=1 Tax=Lacipirellula parvula TaxID=2650471 RepID=A0A5K7XBI4_9BACT|nr:hypothetical protein PLANPX_3337 [Lacipirellula parvula]